MKIIVNTKKFKNGLKTIQKGIATKAVMPILRGVEIKATNCITLVSNNLEIGVTTQIEGDIIEEGCIVIPGNELIKYINKVNTTEITIISKDDYSVTVQSKGKYNIKGFNPDEFPTKRKVNEKEITVSQEWLKRTLEKTDYAISQDQTNPVITGVKLLLGEDNIGAVATDTYRISLFNDIPSDDVNIVLPKLAADVLVNQLDQIDQSDVNIIYDERYIEFDFNNIILQSRLIGADRYPNYKQVLSEDFITTLEIDKEQFKNAIEKSKICNEEGNVKLNIKENEIIISGIGQYQKYEETIEIEKDGENLEIFLNGDYILDFIKTVNTNTIIIQSAGKLKQQVFKESINDIGRCIIMPVRQ